MHTNKAKSQIALRSIALIAVLLVAGCNDLPTDVGTDTVQGTDTVYAVSSLSQPFLILDSSIAERSPLVNGSFFLLGNTANESARVFVEFEFPKIIDTSRLLPRFEVVRADLLLWPTDYIYGDTSDKGLSVKVYELKRPWSLNVTWDSVWDANGATMYYDVNQPVIGQLSDPGASTFPVRSVPIDTSIVRKWIEYAQDTTLRKQLHGIALLATNSSSIRQFRNLAQSGNGLTSRLSLRLEVNVYPKPEPDSVFYQYRVPNPRKRIFFADGAVANFVNTPEPTKEKLTIQGAHVRSALIRCSIEDIPEDAIFNGGTFRIAINKPASQIGSLGMDNVLTLKYRPKTGPVLILTARDFEGDGVFVFENLGQLLQVLRRNGGVGDLVFESTEPFLSWRMNRLTLHDSRADSTLRPRLVVSYVLPNRKKM